MRQATCLLIKDCGVSMTMQLNTTLCKRAAVVQIQLKVMGALLCCTLLCCVSWDVLTAGLAGVEQWLQVAHSVVLLF